MFRIQCDCVISARPFWSLVLCSLVVERLILVEGELILRKEEKEPNEQDQLKDTDEKDKDHPSWQLMACCFEPPCRIAKKARHATRTMTSLRSEKSLGRGLETALGRDRVIGRSAPGTDHEIATRSWVAQWCHMLSPTHLPQDRRDRVACLTSCARFSVPAFMRMLIVIQGPKS